MVFGRQPENGNGVDAGVCRNSRCRESFVESVGRAGEESYLLAGDDGGGPCSQAIKIAANFRAEFLAGREAAILFAQNFDHGLANGGIEADLAGCSSDSLRRRRMRVVGNDTFKVINE